MAFRNGATAANYAEMGEVAKAAGVVFAFQTIEGAFQFVSGTETVNEIVKPQASETKFAMIGDATLAKASKLTDSDFSKTTMEISNKLESGRKAVAFWNDKCKGIRNLKNNLIILLHNIHIGTNET